MLRKYEKYKSFLRYLQWKTSKKIICNIFNKTNDQIYVEKGNYIIYLFKTKWSICTYG